MKEGDLPVTILFMEAAILQDPGDAEVPFLLHPAACASEGDQMTRGFAAWCFHYRKILEFTELSISV